MDANPPSGPAAPRSALPGSVLFVCTSNVLRSPMAAGLMRRRFGPLVRVESAGVRPGLTADPLTMIVMDEIGVDLSGHRGRDVGDLEDQRFDLVISLSPEAHHHVLELLAKLGEAAEYWPTFDPSLAEGSREQRLMEYRMTRDGLDRRIAQRFERPSTG